MLDLIPVSVFGMTQNDNHWTIQLQSVPDPFAPYAEEHPMRLFELRSAAVDIDVDGDPLWHYQADTCFKFRTVACRAARIAGVGLWSKKFNVLVTFRHLGTPMMWGAFIVEKGDDGWNIQAEHYDMVEGS